MRARPATVIFAAILLASSGHGRSEDRPRPFVAPPEQTLKIGAAHEVLNHVAGGQPRQYYAYLHLLLDLAMVASLLPLRLLLAEDNLVNL